LLREDSRGAHFRSDFEKTDNTKWLCNVYLSRDGAGPHHWTVPVKLNKLRP
jgi:succinate dehydrogenase/fumarate reductase flavoprotein subunit